MNGYMSREEFEKRLEEMREQFSALETCRLEFEVSKKRYEQLLQSAPDAMVFVNKEARIVLFNAQFGALFGYTEEELAGRDLDDLVPERFRGKHRENVARYFENPRVRPMGTGLQIYGLRKDGTEFPADISLSPLWTEDGIVAVGAVRDITEKKKAEDEKHRMMEHLAEVEKLSALGRVAANVADEIRNPLTAVGGFARRLRKIVDTDREREYAEYIITEVDRLESILRDVLAYSRTRSPLLERHDLSLILGEVLKTAEERIRRQSVSLRTELRAGAFARVDRAQVSDAISRIVANALDAMPGGGSLSVATGREIVQGAPYVSVTIRDTGEGIPPERIEKVFEPFFTTRISPKGTGLGLTIARSIVEEEGGSIRLESAQGTGTAVTLLFPDVNAV